MGMLEIAEAALQLGMKYGPIAYAAAKRWVDALMASPLTTAEERAALQALLVRMDAADKRVDDAPNIPRRPE
jgi:hypothetical protein